MTARLRDVLHEAAQDVPTYRVYDRAVATARRSRRRASAGIVAAAVAVVFAAVMVVVPMGGVARFASPGAPASAPAALPNRVSKPVLGTPHATSWPHLGPAAVIFSGGYGVDSCFDECDDIGVVGARDDRYRIFRPRLTESPAGDMALLSPDGRQVAYPAGEDDHDQHVAIIDLVTGHTRAVPSVVPRSVDTTPVGWSRDGHRLVVRDIVPIDPQVTDYELVLSIVNLDNNQSHRLGTGQTTGGFAVAFAPDHRRFAYQIETKVTVTDVDGGPAVSFDVSGDAALAGKGAWTPDGTALAIVQRQGSDWTLRYVDPATGADISRPATPAVSGVTAIRLLGWNPSGAAVVVAYQPEPRSPTRFDQPWPMDQRVAYGEVRTIRVLALAPGASAPTTLLRASDRVMAIDVADDVVAAGHTREAHPPFGIVGPQSWNWAQLTFPLLFAALLIACLAQILSRLGRGRSAPTGK